MNIYNMILKKSVKPVKNAHYMEVKVTVNLFGHKWNMKRKINELKNENSDI